MNKKEEIFTIGDKTNNGTISKFELDSNGIRVFFEEKPKNYHVSLNSLSKVQQKLFTTEDGVEITDDNAFVWGTNNKSFSTPEKISVLIALQVLKVNKNFKYFSTEEAAKEFVLMNKPCLSINDCLELNDKMGTNPCGSHLLKKNLKELVKSKL